MKIAFISESNVQVEVLSVKGGWTAVRDLKTAKEFKVRNGSLGKITELTEPQTLAAAKAKVEKRTGKEADFLKSGNIMPTSRPKLSAEERKNGKIDALYLQFYKPFTIEREGRKVRSMDKGDDLAMALRHLSLDAVYAKASVVLNEAEDDLRIRYKHLNPGMIRMNLGNRMRKALREQAKA